MSIADVFTVLNAILGFLAVVAALEGELEWAYTLLVMCVLADGLDGIVARRFSRRWNLGDFLDIMADSASFGLAPAVILYATYGDALGHPDLGISGAAGRALVLVGGGALIAAGVLRLARFCFESRADKRTFLGLPIPAAALMVVMSIMVGVPGLAVVALVLVASGCMVSDLYWPKPLGAVGGVTGILALLLVVARLGDPYVDGLGRLAGALAALGLFWTLMYILVGPFAVRVLVSRGLIPDPSSPEPPDGADGCATPPR